MDLQINKNGWVTIRRIFYVSYSQWHFVTCRKPFRTICAVTSGPRKPAHFSVTYKYMCTDLLAALQTASRLVASVSTRCASNQFPHHSLLVDSWHCMWNYMRQSYGLTYYSLHYTQNRLLVTSQPISQNMLMTANCYTIKLYNIVNVSEFRQPNAHVHETASTWLW
jgi:hypothetical protein